MKTVEINFISKSQRFVRYRRYPNRKLSLWSGRLRTPETRIIHVWRIGAVLRPATRDQWRQVIRTHKPYEHVLHPTRESFRTIIIIIVACAVLLHPTPFCRTACITRGINTVLGRTRGKFSANAFYHADPRNLLSRIFSCRTYPRCFVITFGTAPDGRAFRSKWISYGS